MRASSDENPIDKIRLLANSFLQQAWKDLRIEHVVPASRFRPYLHVGTDYEGQPLMGMSSFTALKAALLAHFPNRFEEPLKANKPEFPNHYIFRLLEAYIAHSAKLGDDAEGAAIASTVVNEFLAALTADEYTLVAARLVSHVTTATMEPIEIDGLVVQPLRQPSYDDPPIAAISKLIPDARRAFKDGPPFGYDPPTSIMIAQETSKEASKSVAARLTHRIERFLLLTRLIHGATVQSHWQITGPTTLISEASIDGNGFVKSSLAFQFVQRIATISADDTAGYSALDNLLDNAEIAREKMFTTSFDMALNRFTRTYTSGDLLDAFVDLATTMEAIFVSGGSSNEDVGLRLRTRAAALLATNEDSGRKIFDDVRRLYNIRSKLVHGGSLAMKDLDKDLKNLVPNYSGVASAVALSFAVDRFRDLARRAILARLALASGETPLWPWAGDTQVDAELADDQARQHWRNSWTTQLSALGLSNSVGKAEPAVDVLAPASLGKPGEATPEDSP